MHTLEELGKWGLLFGTLALAVFVGCKWDQRRRFMRALRMARISVNELRTLQLDGQMPLLIDVRPVVSQQTGRIPGAVTIPVDGIDTFVLDAPSDREVVLYCACPNEASAAVIAKQLMQKGFRYVRPLAGGIDAWISEGHALEHPECCAL